MLCWLAMLHQNSTMPSRGQQVAQALGEQGLHASMHNNKGVHPPAILAQQTAAVETLVQFIATLQPEEAKLASAVIQRFADPQLPLPIKSLIALNFVNCVPLEKICLLNSDSVDQIVDLLTAHSLKQVKLPGFNYEHATYALILLGRFAQAGLLSKNRIDLLFLCVEQIIRPVEFQHLVELQHSACHFVSAFISSLSAEALEQNRIALLLEEKVFDSVGVYFEVKKLLVDALGRCLSEEVKRGHCEKVEESSAVWFLNWSLSYLVEFLPVTDFLVPLFESIAKVEASIRIYSTTSPDRIKSYLNLLNHQSFTNRGRRAILLVLAKLSFKGEIAELALQAIINYIESSPHIYLMYLATGVISSIVNDMESWNGDSGLLRFVEILSFHQNRKISGTCYLITNILRRSFPNHEDIRNHHENLFSHCLGNQKLNPDECGYLRVLSSMSNYVESKPHISIFFELLCSNHGNPPELRRKALEQLCSKKLKYFPANTRKRMFQKLVVLYESINQEEDRLYFLICALEISQEDSSLAVFYSGIDKNQILKRLTTALKVVKACICSGLPQIAQSILEHLCSQESRKNPLFPYLETLFHVSKMEHHLLESPKSFEEKLEDAIDELHKALLKISFCHPQRPFRKLKFFLEFRLSHLEEILWSNSLSNHTLKMSSQSSEIILQIRASYAVYIHSEFKEAESKSFLEMLENYPLSGNALLPIFRPILDPSFH